MAHLSALDELAQLFKRQAKCVTCPNTPPSCKDKVCPEGTTCILQVQSCDSCAQVECQKLANKVSNNAGSANKNKSGAPVGAIVGGVVGALVVICILAFLVFRRNKKKQRAAYEASVAAWAVEKENRPDGSYNARASTHSVGSIASTVLTRASNVIQIAYIPGVTNRSNPSSPGYLGVPPVPSIPGQHTSQASGDHFFSADDIARQSVWSTHSGLTVNSADPRASVATTIYRSNAVVSPLAATATVVRAKAAVVTVKNSPAPSSGGSSPRFSPADTPPVPAIDLAKFPAPKSNDGLLSPTASTRPPNSPAFSVGSTFLNKMSMATTPASGDFKRQSSGNHSFGDPSPFSDRASIDNDRNRSTGRTSPARHMEGDIRMSFRPISEIGSEAGDSPSSPSRGKSPFGDENRVDRP